MAVINNWDDPTKNSIAPPMGDNEAIRRLLYIINLMSSASGSSGTASETTLLQLLGKLNAGVGGVQPVGATISSNPQVIAGIDVSNIIRALRTDATGAISVTNGTSAGFNSAADLVVATAGTAVQGPNVAVTRFARLSGRLSNTGSIYIGGPGVTNSGGLQRGMELLQGGISADLPVSNLNQIWVNADTNGDAVGIIYL